MKKYQTVSTLSSQLTLQDLDLFKKNLVEYTDDSIQMYLDRFVHKKKLEAIGLEKGFSKEMVRRRINQLIGNINSFKNGKYENRSTATS